MNSAELHIDCQPTVLPTDRYQLGRQAIIDRNFETFGFELLYRPIDRLARDISSEIATSQVITTSMTDADLPALRAMDKPLFINMTKEHLMNLHLIGLPPTLIVYEILEDIIIDDELVDRIQMHRGMGYRFALDDFSLTKHNRRLIPLVSFIKLDVLALSPEELEQHVALIKRIGPSHIKLVAEKVETSEQLLKCQALGFDYYQGFLFSKPDLVTGFGLTPVENSVLRIQQRLHNPDLSFKEVAGLLANDPALVYKLLRFLGNTHALLPANELSKVLEEIGLPKLRTILSLFAQGQLRSMPSELARQALLKAHQSRNVAIANGLARPEEYFFAGLISHLDEFTQLPIRSLVKGLPISRQIKEAVSSGSGKIGEVLRAVNAHRLSSLSVELPTGGLVESVNLTHAQCEATVNMIIEDLGDRLDRR